MSSTCSTDDDSTNNNSSIVDVVELTTISTDGTWRITSFVEEGNDETYHFSGYSFTFGEDGILTATNGSNTVNGTWGIMDDSSNDDDSSSNEEFVILFDVPESSEFEDLNDDWDIQSYSSTKIELIDISGGNGGTDTLVLEKN